jgi:prepilin-type N-terminal cleavage/methylation domain-containing protein
MSPHPHRRGFTLAEVVITIALVGAVLIYGLQGLNNAMFQAAHTRDSKIARELAKLTLAQASAGLFSEDIDVHMEGDYSDQDYPSFTWELVLGDEEFDEEPAEGEQRFDSWNPDGVDEDDEDEERAEQPYEVVRVKVRFPAAGERVGEVIIEQWLDWEAVYGTTEELD